MKTRTCRLFMNIRYIRPRHADYPVNETHVKGHVVAQWITRGIGSTMYESKRCATMEDAVKLARRWLERVNRPGPYGEIATRYVDTTDQPERFGYSHEGA